MSSEDLVNGVCSELGISEQSTNEANKLWEFKVDEGTLLKEIGDIGQ